MITNKLPDECYTFIEESKTVAIIYKDQRGFKTSTFDRLYTTAEAKERFVKESNERAGISKAHESAMIAGALMGFGHPDANPMMYNTDGTSKSENRKMYWSE